MPLPSLDTAAPWTFTHPFVNGGKPVELTLRAVPATDMDACRDAARNTDGTIDRNRFGPLFLALAIEQIDAGGKPQPFTDEDAAEVWTWPETVRDPIWTAALDHSTRGDAGDPFVVSKPNGKSGKKTRADIGSSG